MVASHHIKKALQWSRYFHFHFRKLLAQIKIAKTCHKLETYLRSLGLYIGKKLYFLFLHLHLFLQVFYGIICLSCNCFLSWYARDAGFSHMCTELKTACVMQFQDPFSGVGWGQVVPYIIAYYCNTYFQTLFPFFLEFLLD